jgi:hypothetical protein
MNKHLPVLIALLGFGLVGCGKYSDDETYTFDNCIEELTGRYGIVRYKRGTSVENLYSSMENNGNYSSLKDKHSVTVNVQEKLLKIDGEVLPVEWIKQTTGYGGGGVDGYVLSYTPPKKVYGRVPDEDDILFVEDINMALYDSGQAALEYRFAGRGYKITNEVISGYLVGSTVDRTVRNRTVEKKEVRVRYLCSESE